MSSVSDIKKTNPDIDHSMSSISDIKKNPDIDQSMSSISDI
jgi:hypothetical protein